MVPVGLARWLSGKESTCNAGDTGSIPGSGQSSGAGNGNPLQYSCLENPMDSEPGRPQSVGSQRVRHERSDLAQSSYWLWSWVWGVGLTDLPCDWLMPIHVWQYLLQLKNGRTKNCPHSILIQVWTYILQNSLIIAEGAYIFEFCNMVVSYIFVKKILPENASHIPISKIFFSII